MEPVVTALQARRGINFARRNHQAPSILVAPLVQKRPHFCEQRQCTFERSNADLPFDFGDVVGDRLDRSLPRLAASGGQRDPSAAAVRRVGRACHEALVFQAPQSARHRRLRHLHDARQFGWALLAAEAREMVQHGKLRDREVVRQVPLEKRTAKLVDYPDLGHNTERDANRHQVFTR